jgi:thiol-disulfide isomerase/thioredoxin
MKRLLISLLFMSATSFADTPSLQPWSIQSLEAAKELYTKQPFLLVLWSLDCPACFDEFEALSHWKKQHPDSHLVLVSTDTIDMKSEVLSVLQDYQLEQADIWIFSNEPTAKLRHSIDGRWFGELPRSYFFSSQHKTISHSGALTNEQLHKWQRFISTQPPP